jgi:hypothetical protein
VHVLAAYGIIAISISAIFILRYSSILSFIFYIIGAAFSHPEMHATRIWVL